MFVVVCVATVQFGLELGEMTPSDTPRGSADLTFGDGQRASRSGYSNYQVFMFGSYFGLRVDI